MLNYFFCLLFISISLFADKVIVPKEQIEIDNPWFTGPLISPSAAVVPGGHFDIEPYFYFTAFTGSYGEDWHATEKPTLWINTFQPALEFGLTSWMDIQFYPTLNYNYQHHQAEWGIGDPVIVVDFQLLAPSGVADKSPYIKLVLSETFPVGKYRNFNPKKGSVEINGAGTFQSEIGLVIGKLLHIKDIYFILPRIYFRSVFQSSTHLKGFNAYGGGYGTNGRLYPGKLFEIDLSLEMNLSQNWALACDLVGIWTGRYTFRGKAGILAPGIPASSTVGSSAQFSLAPAIEYNWSDNLGVIAGGYFSFAGRNSQKFSSLIIAINYYN